MYAARILVPIDLSASAHGALTYAVSLAAHLRSELDIIHVLEEDRVVAEPAIERMLEATATSAPLACRFMNGEPAAAIVATAVAGAHALIVMGAHGLSRGSSLRLGQVAESVVELAPCGVLAIQSGDDPIAVAPWLPRDPTRTHRTDVVAKGTLAQVTLRCPSSGTERHASECLYCPKFIAACLSLDSDELELVCKKDVNLEKERDPR